MQHDYSQSFLVRIFEVGVLPIRIVERWPFVKEKQKINKKPSDNLCRRDIVIGRKEADILKVDQ